jgi:pimeloyl-ACP methyl ester carboxylesterase
MKSEFNSISLVPKIKTKTLFLLGDKDRNIPIGISRKVIKKCSCETNEKIIVGASHDSILYNAKCWDYVNDFLAD